MPQAADRGSRNLRLFDLGTETRDQLLNFRPGQASPSRQIYPRDASCGPIFNILYWGVGDRIQPRRQVGMLKLHKPNSVSSRILLADVIQVSFPLNLFPLPSSIMSSLIISFLTINSCSYIMIRSSINRWLIPHLNWRNKPPLNQAFP
jgi:hypothetical protein